jgi:hypothetical protein
MTEVRFRMRLSRWPAAEPSGPRADVARQAEAAGRDPGGAGERAPFDKRPPDGVVEQGVRCAEATAPVGA